MVKFEGASGHDVICAGVQQNSVNRQMEIDEDRYQFYEVSSNPTGETVSDRAWEMHISDDRVTDYKNFRGLILTEDRLLLEDDISLEDISNAIKCMKSGKAAGPDGLPSDFYKTFESKLLTPLLEMYRESFQKGILPPSLRGAIIILLPKPGKTNDK